MRLILEKKQFMADAAHELRTPIAAVIAQLHILSLVDEKAGAKKIIEDMRNNLWIEPPHFSHQLIDLAKIRV